jgi:hypothetical protein
MLHDSTRIGVSIIAQTTAHALQAVGPLLHNEIRNRLQRLVSETSGLSGKRSDEIIARETKFLQSSLSPFLATPLRSDAAEVSRTLGEALSRCVKESWEDAAPRVLRCGSGAIVLPPELNEPLRSLADAGLVHLERALSQRLDDQSRALEVSAVLSGGMHPDLVTAALHETVVTIPYVASYSVACGGVALPVEASGAMITTGSACESVLALQVPRPLRTEFVGKLGEAAAKCGESPGLVEYSIWTLLAPYSQLDTLQLRMGWINQEVMIDGVRRTMAETGRAGPGESDGGFIAWFKHLNE